jgi:hypothetical protein
MLNLVREARPRRGVMGDGCGVQAWAPRALVCSEVVAWQSVSMASRDLARLRRWEDSGGIWRVVSRGRMWKIDLITCLGDETMECLRSDEADVRSYIGDRDASDEST